MPALPKFEIRNFQFKINLKWLKFKSLKNWGIENSFQTSNFKLKIKRAFRWLTRTPRRKAAWVLLVAYLVNQFVYPLIPFLKDNTVHANGVIEPVALGTSLFVNRNPEFNVWFGDRLDQSKHKIVFEVSGHEIEMRLRGASNQELGASDEIDELIANLRKELQKPYLTTTKGNDSIDQKIGDKATIRYEILPDRGVKESIIISEVAPTNQFVFSLKLSNGVQLKSKLENLNDTKLNASGSAAMNYYFVDSKGKYLAHFEPLVMTDAAGAMSNDIKMDISDNTLTITANQDWLNASDRVFPIDLDPTIVHDQNPDFSSGTENRSVVSSTSQVETQYKELQTDINTVGLWHFNEGSGTTAYDASGNNNTGTLTNGPVWNGPTDTQVGLGKSSLKFDGVNDYITYSGTVTPRSAISFSFWLNTSSTAEEIIFDNTNGNRNNEGYFAEINYPTANKLRFVGAKVTTENFAFVSNTSVNDGKWHHIALTWDGTTGAGGAKIYIDGVLDATATSASASTNAPSYNFRIGATASGATIPFVGSLDEFKIDNISRTPEEITASASRFPYSVHESPVIDFGSTPNTLDSLNYTASGVQTGDGEKAYSRDGLIAQWNLNETSGTVAYNTAGNDSCGGTPSNCNGNLTTFASTASQDQAAGTGWTANNKRWGAGGLMFDNSDDYVNVPYVAALNPGGKEVSIEAWINGTLSTSDRILNHTSVNAGYGLRIDDASAANLEMIVGDGTSYHFCTKPHGMTSGTWNHVAGTYNGYQFDLYVNGKNIGTCVDPMTPSWGSVAVVLGGAPDYWGGTLDAVKLYSRAITASEVMANSQVGNVEFQTRTGATSTPNDGTWETWKTTSGTGDTQIAALDNVADIATPSASIWQGVPIATSSSALVMEGTGSLRTKIGAPQVEQSVAALWHMEETSGTSAYIKDSSPNAKDGTPTGTTAVDGFFGVGRNFNGTSDYISAGSVNASVKSVDFWVNPTSTSTEFIDLNGSAYINATTGTIGTTGFTSPTVYVNGAVSSTIVANQWQHIAVTTGTALNASAVNIGKRSTSYLAGKIDEVRISTVARSADEIAEGYRAGRDHRISKTISSTDLSAKTKLPFYVASDRPGTFMEATIGESAYANYEPDSNSRALWHLEEQTGTAPYIKDSSGLGNNLSIGSGTTFSQGKIGKARDFNGSSDYLECTHANCGGNTKLDTNGTSWSVGAWVYGDTISAGGTSSIMGKLRSDGATGWHLVSYQQKLYFVYGNGGGQRQAQGATTISTGTWHYVAGTINNGTISVYLDGVLDATVVNGAESIASNTTDPFRMGTASYSLGNYWDGRIDEAFVSASVKTPDEIRQAYEVGKRTHQITIDFKADLDSSNLITSTSDLSFAIQPDIDIVGAPLSVARGEKIIVKENVNGTEYISQGNVTNVTYESNVSNANAWTQDASSQGSSTTVTVTAWDSGSTVPSGGFTTAATVFKWQREYMDLTQIPLSTQRDAITRITLRVTDGSQGSNIWIDDFESADYSDGSRVAIGSTANRYFQYRTILTSPNTQTSPTLTNVTVNYNSGTTAQAPKVKDASSDFSATGTSLNRVTDTGSASSPQLELAYKELPADRNTVGLWHFNEGTGTATDSSGNSNTGTLTSGASWNTAANSKLGASSVLFDGTNDYITFPDSTSLSVTGSLTVEAWAKRTATGSEDIIVAKDNGSTARSYMFRFNTANTMTFLVCSTSNCGTYAQLDTTSTFTDTTNWHHYAAVFSAGGYVKIYYDGVENASGTTTVTSIYDGTTALEMGDRTGSTGPLTGSLDEVRISNIARTPEEIKYDAGRRPYGVYTSDVQNLGSKVSSIDNIRWTENGVQTGDGETPYSTNGLVAQWNFNETSGTTASNAATASCGTACNATLNNFASTTSQDQAAGTGWTKDNRKWPARNASQSDAGGGAGAINIASAATADTITVSDPTSNQLDPNSSDLTLGMWVKTNDVTAELLSNNANNGTACTANGYYLGIDASGYPNFYLDTNGATAGCDAQISSLATGKINDGNWHYLAVSVTRGTSALMYLDGVQIGSDTSVTSYSSITVTGNIQIGSNANYDGALDAIQVYSRALSATEILSNAQSGNVELQTRTGTTTTPNDGTWEEWRPSGNSTEVQLDNLQTLSPVQKINTSNLVGYWKLDEVSGNRADSVGSNTLTDNATVTSKAGHLNLAGQFTSANSEYLSVTDNANISTGETSFTVASWVYLDTKSAFRPIFSKATASNYEFDMLYNSTADRFRFSVINSAGSAQDAINADALGSVSTGQWYFVVGWHDDNANTINIQINNGIVNSEIKDTVTITDGTAPLEIGAAVVDSRYMDGRIDETAMWKRVLTADERTRLYEDGLDKTNDSVVGGINRTIDSTTKFEGTGSEKLTIGSPQVDSSTVALWHLDETSGSGAYIKDATANANNGTPANGPTVTDGFYGKAYNFDGTNDVINIGDSSTLKNQDFTLSAWIKPNSVTGNHDVLVQNKTTQYANLYTTGTQFKFYSASLSPTSLSAAGTISIGKWTHLAVTKSGTTVTLYQDGTSVGSGTQTGTIGYDTSGWSISNDSAEPFNGVIDEVKMDSIARTADEIAEAYRAGRDHRLSKTISSTDLSTKTKLPFYVASDRPGTFMEATVGESAYANYETDANTVGLWHLDEQTGTANTYLKDSSGQGNNTSTITGTTHVQGKVGKARDFNGTSDVLIITNASNLNPTTAVTISSWIKTDAVSGTNQIVEKMGAESAGYMTRLTTGAPDCLINGGNSTTSPTAISTGVWTHVVCTYDSANIKLYVNGQLMKSTAYTTAIATHTGNLQIGKRIDTTHYFDGSIDEVRIDNTARTADEIRQAYEIGKRTHTITNDFVTTPQAAYSSGTSVTINNPYGTTNLTDTLSIGDTMIFKENVGGTETVSQGTVTGVTNTSSTYGTVTLLAAPTFPSGGYTTAAKVFKWQREFWDISQIRPMGQIDAINRITLRVTDGSQGANVWIDDLKAAGPYLTQSTTRTASVTSTPRQYMQYRAILSTTDPAVSPSITHISLQYHTSPAKVTGSDTLGADGSYDRDGNLHLGSNNVKKVSFYDRTKDQISYALDFDNSNDYVAVGTGPTSVKTVEFWVNPNSTSTEFIDLNGSAYINVSSGTIGTTGFTSPTVYVDGTVSSTVVANKWQHIAVTTGTGLNATALNFGKRSTSYFNGIMDEVALYSSALTAAQVTTDYNARRLAGTETGLVALYHFDEGQGTRAYDSVGGFHGTLTNMAATAWVNSQNDRDQSALSVQTLGIDPNWANGVGRESSALDFTATNQYISGSSITVAYPLTLEAWIYADSWATATSVVVIGNARVGLESQGVANRLSIWYQTSAGNYVSWHTSNPPTGEWIHVAGVINGLSSGDGKLFYNGVNQSVTFTSAGSPASSYTNNYYVGAFVDGTPAYGFDGRIDEVRISSNARYSSNFSPSRRLTEDANTKVLLHLDEGTGTASNDSSSNGYNGTLTNSPTWVTDARVVMDNNSRYLVLGSQSSVSGDKGMEIYAVSTTQFKYRWTGDQTWSSAVNFSSYPFATPAQLGTTGVYVGFDTTNGTFGDESYFLIPSWAIQQFSSTRGVRRTFPERSYLVATDLSFDIIDADDNTLWMRTSNGVSGQLLGTQTLNIPSGITMTQGQLMVSTNGTAGTGVYRLDFNRDVAYRYNVTDRTTGTNNLAKRNATDWSWGSADTGQNLIDSVVNDVSLLTSNGRLVMGTANNTGLTKIANIMSNDTSYDYSDVTSNAYNRVKLAENYVSGTGAVGDMYALNSTNNALERWNNVIADSANETNGTPDATVNATSTPALFASAQAVNDLDVKTGTSLASSGNNTVFVGHNGGTTTFQEHRATLASSSVKYYTKDYIGEEMVGNISAYWPLNADNTASDLEDVSIGAKNFTATNITAADAVTGVRNKATDFDGSTEYLTASATVIPAGAKSVGFWMKTTTTADTYMIDNNGADSTLNGMFVRINATAGKIQFRQLKALAGQSDYLITTNGSVNDGSWHFIVHTWDGTTGSNKVRIYIDGTLDIQNTATSATNNTPSNNLRIGANAGTPVVYYSGIFDEVFATATELSATQISQIYVSGLEAKNNKYRVKLASDTVNQLAGSINVVKGVAASDNYIFAGTNTTGADDGILSRVLLRGDVTDKTYDESSTDPLIVDNDINSVAVSKDGAYIVVGTDDQGITIIHNGAAANRLRSGSKVQGPSKRPSN